VGIALVSASLTGLLMKAALLDVVSFWPAWVLALLISLALWPLRRRGIARIGAVLPLLLFSWVAGAVSLHLLAWEQLPSASADFAGPAQSGVSDASLSLEVNGRLELDGDATDLYDIAVLRSGGGAAPAEALERIDGAMASVELRERESPGWFASAGWHLNISRLTAWELSIVAQDVDADLRGVPVRRLDVVGDGIVMLGSPVGEFDVTVSGDVELVVPVGVAVEVDGAAVVPEGWEPTEAGARFAASGPVITIITSRPEPIQISYP
jgi:hypothetical protein